MFILGGSVPTVKRNIHVLAVASKEMELEVNAEKLSTCPCLEIRIQDDVTG
jgi:hypothetical protein